MKQQRRRIYEPRLPRRPNLVSAVVVALTCAGAAPAARATAVDTTTSPSQLAGAILRHVRHRERGLHSSECALSIRFRERSFPYLSKAISGTAYFEEPGRFAATFASVPSVLGAFPGAYNAMMDVARWSDRFKISTEATQPIGGHADAVLHFVARDPSSGLQYGRAFVDRATWTIDAMDWHFKGMQFDITQTYKTLGSFRVLGAQQATIRVPIARAGATATFAHYRTNVAIAPHVFTADRR